MTTAWELSDLWVGGPVAPWEQLGFVSRADSTSSHREHRIVLPDLSLLFREDVSFGQSELCGWAFCGGNSDQVSTSLDSEVQISIDGISTVMRSGARSETSDSHRLGILGVDHIVVMTGSLERTCGAITETIGDPLRRIRDAGRGVRQGFHRAGRVIIEVVERPDLDPQQPASLWGFVVTVADLDEIVAWLGPDVISSPRDAVQPGRRIATLRSGAGLGVPLALMTPNVDR